MVDADVEEKIWDLHRQGKWEEILNKFGQNRFLPWIWPDQDNLDFIAKHVRKQKTNSLASIGCGSGLLEWLLEKATGIQVTGIEADRNWWTSKYSSGTFIPVVFVEDSKKGDFGVHTHDSVLLFCYFNNLEAFLHYLDNFKGNSFIVIGPGPGRGTYTVPEPFHLPENVKEKWTLSDSQEVRSSKDFIAVYIRK